ncbi:MAG: MFS transporter [Candidatus Symbiothrix sp.]|jgi:FHS family L-fucose permease-like MFS transporter|nr:MFS transporter [Candidatus Symbiothrix sp.]
MTKEQQQNYTLPIVMMILLFGMISFVTNLAAPMGIVLKAQFGVSNFQGSLGNAANFIAYAVMGIPSGILLQRIGYKRTALIAIAVGFLGIFIQYLSGYSGQDIAFWVYLLGAFVAGFSMCLLNTVVNPMLNTLGGGGNKGNQLIQVGGSFNSVMATLTPMLVGILIGDAVKAQITNIFPFMYAAMAVFAVVFVVLYLVRIPEPTSEKLTEPLGKLMFGVLKFQHFILGAIGIFVYVGIEVGTPQYMNYLLVDPNIPHPLNTTTAGFVAGTYWLLMLVGRLLGASIGNKVSSKLMLTATSALGIVLVLLAIFSPSSREVALPVLKSEAGVISFGMLAVPINALFLVLVGLCTSIMWGSIFNMAVEGLGKYLAAATGIFMVMVCGGGILPSLQGKIVDLLGSNITSYLSSYWVILIGLAYLLYYALIGSKNVNKDISVK